MKKWRINLIFILIILFGAAIIGRLIHIQIFQHDLYKVLAEGQQKIFLSLTGDRGEIFFSGGQILATNIKGKYLFASPREIEEKKEEIARELAQILDVEEELILKKLEKNSLFEQIKIGLTEEEENALKQINLPGIYLGQAAFREYPQNLIASQVIGFLGGEGKGQYGVEGYYDDILQGKKEFQEERTRGYFFSERSIKGSDIFLTLDYNIQFVAEKLLEKAKEDLNIESGQIIVIDPGSGKILALANFPNFNPNKYNEYANEEKEEIFQNSVIQKLFEPGSVFKPITMAGALDQGKVTPQTTFVDDGGIKIGIYTINNYAGRIFGKQTMIEVLEKSINTGAVFIGKQLGHDFFLKYMDRFAFFEPTGIDLQGEIFSENVEVKKGYEINFATASFGQGIEITPIQLVRAFCAIANGGRLVRPYVVEKIVENGKSIEIQPEISSKRVVSQKTASQLTAMLVSVVENGPYTKGAKIPGYYIAGKTGTAQVSWSALGIDKRGYSDESWQSFIGFAPAFDPRFLILVKLDNPETKTAEYSAVPIFTDLAKYIINYMQIPPDYE